MQPLAAETHPALDPVHASASDWPALVRQIVPQGPLGLIGMDELPLGAARALAPIIRDDPEAAGLLDRMRLIKEPAALDLHRAGAAICDAVFSRLPLVLKPGGSAGDAQRILEAYALAQGADYCRTWLTVRAQADRPRYWPEETAGTVATGDQVLMGIALTVDGHWAHGIRMGAVGLAMARPGVGLCDLADAMEAALVSGTQGMDLSGAERFRFGHGLGMSYEDPILTDAFVQSFGTATPPLRTEGAGGVLAPGMVLELHPNLFLRGIGGAALGEMVIITETGAVCPIRHPIAPISL